MRPAISEAQVTHEYECGPHMFPTEPFTPGHEFVGHVVEMGSVVTGFSVYDLVAVGVGISCGGGVRRHRGWPPNPVFRQDRQ